MGGSTILTAWQAEIEAELIEAREAWAEATETAEAAKVRHAAALSQVEAVKAALAALPGLASALALPITGRVSAATLDVETAAGAVRRALHEQQEALQRVARLVEASAQLGAVLTAAEPQRVAA
jgi:hypothetical protein